MKHFNFTKDEFGCGITNNEDNSHCDDLLTYLHCDILKFCGCGNPGSSIELIYSFMKIVKEDRDKENYFDILREFFNNEGMMWLMLYFLDRENLMTHGGAASSGWLTEKGEEFFTLLEEVIKDCDNLYKPGTEVIDIKSGNKGYVSFDEELLPNTITVQFNPKNPNGVTAISYSLQNIENKIKLV